MSDPINLAGDGGILPPAADASSPSSTSPTVDASRTLAVVSHLARSLPMSDELYCLLTGKLGEAVSAACVHGGLPPDVRDALVAGLDIGDIKVLMLCELISEAWMCLWSPCCSNSSLEAEPDSPRNLKLL